MTKKHLKNSGSNNWWSGATCDRRELNILISIVYYVSNFM